MDAFTNRDFLASLCLALTALVISAVLLLSGYYLLAPTLHPQFAKAIEFTETKPISLTGDQFHPVAFASGGVEGKAAVITELANASPEDHAVLVHRRIIRANHFPFLRYHIEGRNPALRVMLFWQRLDAPGENFFMELDYSGEGPSIQNLLRSEDWKGTITELAVGFFGDLRGEPVKLHGVGLEPYGTGRLIEVVWGEWTAFRVWDQTSINVHRGVGRDALVYPVPAVAAWVGLGVAVVLLVRLVRNNRTQGWGGAICVVLIGWLMLDGMWLRQLFIQNIETRHLFAGKTLHEKKLADWDGSHYAAAHAVKEYLAGQKEDLVIFYAANEKPFAERLRFHLLPQLITTKIFPMNVRRIKDANRKYNYIIVLTPTNGTHFSEEKISNAITKEQSESWSIVWSNGSVTMFNTNRINQTGGSW